MRGEDQNTTKMAFRWQANDGTTVNSSLFFQGIRTSIAKKPIFL